MKSRTFDMDLTTHCAILCLQQNPGDRRRLMPPLAVRAPLRNHRSRFCLIKLMELQDMPDNRNGRIIETATEARQAERGPSVAAVLATSLGLVFVCMAVVWYVFFRT